MDQSLIEIILPYLNVAGCVFYLWALAEAQAVVCPAFARAYKAEPCSASQGVTP